jgi:hypothetical protein
MKPTQARMFLEWLILGAAGLGASGLVFAVAGPNPATFSGPQIGLIGLWAILGAVIGAVVGAAQWVALRRYVQVSRWWILSNVAGWAVALPLAGAIETPIETEVGLIVYRIDGSVSHWLLVGAVVGIVASCFQTIDLSLHGKQALRWISINVVGWALALGTGWVAAVTALCIAVGPIGFFSGLLGHAFSGLALLLQMRDPSRRDQQSVPAFSTAPDYASTRVFPADAEMTRSTRKRPNQCADIFYHGRVDAAAESFSADELREMLAALQKRIAGAIADLGEDEMQWRPYMGANSALDILWHLVETELPDRRPVSKDEALASFQRANAAMYKYLNSPLDTDMRVTWWDSEEIPVTRAVWGAIRHRSYHLSELVGLRQAMGGHHLLPGASEPGASRAQGAKGRN